MLYQIVAVRDRAVDVFGQPTFVSHLGAAIRSFGDEINRPHSEERPSPFNAHPDDFDLYHLGTYDDATGVFSQDSNPRQLAIGKDLVR